MPGGEALLVEPDGLEVHRPRPPRRGRRVGRGQAVVIAVHLAGQVEQRLAGVARRPARDELVVLDHRPRDVRSGRRRRPGGRRGRRAPRRPGCPAPAGPEPAVGRRRRAGRAAGSGRRGPVARPAARTRSVRPARTGRRRPVTRTPRAIASSNGVADSDPSAIGLRDAAGRQRAEEDEAARAPPGARTANRISSSVHAIGWRTATTTASRVRATMMNRNVRLPKPGSPPASPPAR